MIELNHGTILNIIEGTPKGDRQHLQEYTVTVLPGSEEAAAVRVDFVQFKILDGGGKVTWSDSVIYTEVRERRTDWRGWTWKRPNEDQPV